MLKNKKVCSAALLRIVMQTAIEIPIKTDFIKIPGKKLIEVFEYIYTDKILKLSVSEKATSWLF